MKTLIAYRTKYGTTRKAAEKIAKRLPGEVDLLDLKEEKVSDVCIYDVILIGASVYGGNIQREVRSFFDQHREDLIVRPYGLFIAAGNTLEVERNYRVYVGKTIYDYAKIKEHIGYSYDFSKMNFFEKTIIKKVSKITEDTENLDMEGIDRIVQWVKEIESGKGKPTEEKAPEEGKAPEKEDLLTE
ncbi:flavodoxin domain-containing protein [Isachenkonia alkalipeptolytica]|nr:flavodoxin domain-containing protein [Isachenkonia alkalipeptolytica]